MDLERHLLFTFTPPFFLSFCLPESKCAAFYASHSCRLSFFFFFSLVTTNLHLFFFSLFAHTCTHTYTLFICVASSHQHTLATTITRSISVAVSAYQSVCPCLYPSSKLRNAAHRKKRTKKKRKRQIETGRQTDRQTDRQIEICLFTSSRFALSFSLYPLFFLRLSFCCVRLSVCHPSLLRSHSPTSHTPFNCTYPWFHLTNTLLPNMK